MGVDMIRLITLTFIDLFVLVFNALLVLRIVLSYLVEPTNGLYVRLIALTEPILLPLRKILPKLPGADFAPLAAFFLLQGLQLLIHHLL